MRSLLFFLLILGVFFVVMLAYSRFQAMRSNQAKPKEQNAQNSEKPMVQCAQCGVYLPKQDALSSPDNQEDFFCCEKHQQAFLEQHKH